MYLRISKQSKNVIYMQVFLVCVMLWLKTVLNFPAAITYTTDLFLLYALVKCFGKFQTNITSARAGIVCLIMGLLLMASVIGLVYNQSSVLLYIWGIRNNGRFFLFFLCCIVLLEKIDIDKIFKMLRCLFWINLFLMMFQYLVQGLEGDYVGGLFGVEQGCNAYVNIFLCVVCAHQIARYLTNRISLPNLLCYVFCAFFAAAISELKVFYVEFVIMLVVAIIANRPTLKTIGILIISLIGIGIGVYFLNQYNPDSLEIFTDSEVRETYLEGEGYTGSGDLNRFTSIATLGKLFLNKNPVQALFGLGIGSCDTSSISFLQSSFFERYGYLHYRWFSHAWIYLEQGMVGLSLYIAFFVTIFIWMATKRMKGRNDLWLLTLAFLPTCLVGMVYNNALQMETSYLIAFTCAIPFVLVKENYTI